MNTAKFIVFEGLEGAGKSTAILTSEMFLKEQGIAYVKTREPGGTEVGEAIRHIFKAHYQHEKIDPKTELLLLYAARLQHIEYLIKPALQRGDWVICDRFELSTLAYQVAGRGQDHAFADFLSKYCVGEFKPDLTIFLDITPEEGLMRAQQRGELDRLEKEEIAFFKRVYEGYQREIQHLSSLAKIDASQNIQNVQNDVLTALQVLVNKP